MLDLWEKNPEGWEKMTRLRYNLTGPLLVKAIRIEATYVILAGICSHKETLDPRGITEQYIEKLVNLTNE